jgi:signal transduction histidine kinase
MSTRHEALGALATLIDLAHGAALADVVIGILREPGDGDVLMVRSASDVTRLSDEEAAPFFAAAASGPALGKGSPAIRLTESAAVILRFAEADRGLAYPIRTGSEMVGAMFFFARGPRRRRQASDSFLGLLLRHVIPQLESLYTLERARYVQVMEERRRIARDLHDSFIQVLAALGLRLDALCAAPAAEPGAERLRRELVQMREVIRHELQRVRAYLAEMREPLSEIGSLPELVERTAEAFQSRTCIPVRAAVESGADEVPPEVVRELAPLLREALTNVEKHARASRVEVSARREADQLLLTVCDDGIGMSGLTGSIPGPAPGHGQGLITMRERARLLGGTLRLGHHDPGGTFLEVSIPLAFHVQA